MNTESCWEGTLLNIGGRALLDDARAEATSYVDMFFPWDGTGPVPPARRDAWWEVIAFRALKAAGARRPDKHG